jgi:hypothetical protein
LKLATPNYGSVLAVAERMRDRDAAEFMAVSPFPDRKALEFNLSSRYGARSDTYVVMHNGQAEAVGAMVQHRPHVVTLAFFSTDRFPEFAHPLTRFIVKRLFPQYRERGVHRIECVSIDGYAEVHRWIEALGLKREAIMPKYGRDGQTFVQFAWVK